MPRLLRLTPLNSIWEGSGNVSALDVLRALGREPDALPALLAECEQARVAALDAHLDGLAATRTDDRVEARGIVSDLAGLQGEPAGAPQPERGLRRLLREAGSARPPGAPTGRSRRGWTPGRSWSACWQHEDAALRGRRADRADHAQPAGRGNGITLDVPCASWPNAWRRPTWTRRCTRSRWPAAKGFCGGYDLVESAERELPNHNPSRPWDPVLDWQMMSRNLRGFMSLFTRTSPCSARCAACVAGGSDMALRRPAGDRRRRPYRLPAARGVQHLRALGGGVGEQRAQAPALHGRPDRRAHRARPPGSPSRRRRRGLDERFEALLERVALTPVNQAVMMKLLVNQALYARACATQALGVFFDGIARHTPEGYAFARRRRAGLAGRGARAGQALRRAPMSGGRFALIVALAALVAIVAVVVSSGGIDLGGGDDDGDAEQVAEAGRSRKRSRSRSRSPSSPTTRTRYAEPTPTPSRGRATSGAGSRCSTASDARSGVFDGRVAPGRIDTIIVHPDDRRTNIQLRLDFELAFSSTHDFRPSRTSARAGCRRATSTWRRRGCSARSMASGGAAPRATSTTW